jgi:hypothetical protein
VDQLVSIALAYQVSAWRKRDTMTERTKRGSWEKFDQVMAKVRDVPHCPATRNKQTNGVGAFFGSCPMNRGKDSVLSALFG